MPPVRTPRARWIEAGLEALAAGGPEAVRIEPLAQSLGVTKGGFYWHFADRQALLEEMLHTWEHALVDDVIERVEAAGGDARDRITRLFSLAGSEEARPLLRAEMAIRDWSRRDADVLRRLRRVDNRRVGYLRELFAELGHPEARALIAMGLFVGRHFVAADPEPQVMRDALALLLAP